MSGDFDFARIMKRFCVAGDFLGAVPYGSGHINDTFAANYSQGGMRVRYLLQRVNSKIFKDVPGLMENVERVCSHARDRLEAAGDTDISRRVLSLVPTVDGRSFFQDRNDDFWRLYIFIEGATGFDVVQNETQAYEAARAFGEFLNLLMDMPGPRLNETIPSFHNTRSRYRAFLDALDADSFNRAIDCRPEIDWMLKREDLSSALLVLYEKGLVRERVTHNDTKLNNVLIDNITNKATCVIDLDTLMPGLSLYDFGDLVRTSTSPAAEDERDLSRVVMQLPMYRALVRGYLDAAEASLSKTEIGSLALGGMVMTFEVGLRFLTDYLNGDAYFKTKRPGHNLDRCRTQMALVESMEQQRGEMDACAG